LLRAELTNIGRTTLGEGWAMHLIVGLVLSAVFLLYLIVLFLDMAYPRDPLRELNEHIKRVMRAINRRS
jgi:thiosulfate reductase cytochrome b subunit